MQYFNSAIKTSRVISLVTAYTLFLGGFGMISYGLLDQHHPYQPSRDLGSAKSVASKSSGAVHASTRRLAQEVH